MQGASKQTVTGPTQKLQLYLFFWTQLLTYQRETVLTRLLPQLLQSVTVKGCGTVSLSPLPICVSNSDHSV